MVHSFSWCSFLSVETATCVSWTYLGDSELYEPLPKAQCRKADCFLWLGSLPRTRESQGSPEEWIQRGTTGSATAPSGSSKLIDSSNCRISSLTSDIFVSTKQNYLLKLRISLPNISCSDMHIAGSYLSLLKKQIEGLNLVRS